MGWSVGLLFSLLYLLTMEPTLSFWDCGEFIATSWLLQVGHAPGAPVYQLLAHCMMLLSGDNAAAVAWLGNALSALAGGATAMLLFWTTARMAAGLGVEARRACLAAAAASACYGLCHTAWFSAVESEVYSLAMLMASAMVWAMVRCSQSDDPQRRQQWVMLAALLTGLSVGVHLLCLLAVPAMAVILLTAPKTSGGPGNYRNSLRCAAFSLLFLIIGLTPYAIIPIRASANPPINMGNPSTPQALRDYLTREQYEKAPLLYGRCYNSPIVGYKEGKPVYAPEMDMLLPRMWRSGANADKYYSSWSGHHGKMVDVQGQQYYKPSQVDNMAILFGYQLGYMYLRYLMHNFSGRYDDNQGFGNLQRGQFVTGIAPVDRAFMGTAARRPASMGSRGHNCYFMLPFLLGAVGIVTLFRRSKRWGWVVATLFLMSGFVLSLYLNHPLYEPRERDYAYVLSFYAFAIWIGMGAVALMDWGESRLQGKRSERVVRVSKSLLIAAVPLLMLQQNLDDHDRSGRYVARDSARNLLSSCDHRAMLFTLGDNDTFPLWYVQQVEGYRTDVQVVNLSLLGANSYLASMIRQATMADADCPLNYDDLGGAGPYRRFRAFVSYAEERGIPVFLSHYAERDKRSSFAGRLRLCGIAYRLDDSIGADSVDAGRGYRLMADSLRWESLEGVYVDETCREFLQQYYDDLLTLADDLSARGEANKASLILSRGMRMVPDSLICNPMVTYRLSQSLALCGEQELSEQVLGRCRRTVDEQLAYYATLSPRMQGFVEDSMAPLLQVKEACR